MMLFWTSSGSPRRWLMLFTMTMSAIKFSAQSKATSLGSTTLLTLRRKDPSEAFLPPKEGRATCITLSPTILYSSALETVRGK